MWPNLCTSTDPLACTSPHAGYSSCTCVEEADFFEGQGTGSQVNCSGTGTCGKLKGGLQDFPSPSAPSVSHSQRRESRKRRHECQQNKNPDPRHWRFNDQVLADLIINSIRTDASDLTMRECSQNPLRTFFTCASISKGCPHKMIAALFSITDLSIKNLPLFLLDMNVLCASCRQELPFNVKVAVSHQTIRRVLSRLVNLVQHASHNASWPTSSMALEWKPNQITGCTVFSIFDPPLENSSRPREKEEPRVITKR